MIKVFQNRRMHDESEWQFIGNKSDISYYRNGIPCQVVFDVDRRDYVLPLMQQLVERAKLYFTAQEHRRHDEWWTWSAVTLASRMTWDEAAAHGLTSAPPPFPECESLRSVVDAIEKRGNLTHLYIRDFTSPRPGGPGGFYDKYCVAYFYFPVPGYESVSNAAFYYVLRLQEPPTAEEALSLANLFSGLVSLNVAPLEHTSCSSSESESCLVAPLLTRLYQHLRSPGCTLERIEMGGFLMLMKTWMLFNRIIGRTSSSQHFENACFPQMCRCTEEMIDSLRQNTSVKFFSGLYVVSDVMYVALERLLLENTTLENLNVAFLVSNAAQLERIARAIGKSSASILHFTGTYHVTDDCTSEEKKAISRAFSQILLETTRNQRIVGKAREILKRAVFFNDRRKRDDDICGQLGYTLTDDELYVLAAIPSNRLHRYLPYTYNNDNNSNNMQLSNQLRRAISDAFFRLTLICSRVQPEEALKIPEECWHAISRYLRTADVAESFSQLKKQMFP